jgi:hypothetical protein
MNFGMRPIEMKRAWIKMTTAVRAATNMTAMIWSPNIGNGYPFGYTTVGLDAANFAALDTNGDKALTQDDDPYRPFYPGKEPFNNR